MSFFGKKKEVVAPPQDLKEIKEAVVVESTPEPEPEVYDEETPEKNEESQPNVEQDEDSELAELEAKKQELLDRKKAKEEAEKAKLAQPAQNQGAQIGLDEVLTAFDARISKIEAVLFRIGVK